MSTAAREETNNQGGGWLRRIETGTAAAFLDETKPPPKITDNVAKVCRDMLACYSPDDPPWQSAKETATRLKMSWQTVLAICHRLTGAGWFESKLDHGTRVFRLTAEGIEVLREELGDAAVAAQDIMVPASVYDFMDVLDKYLPDIAAIAKGGTVPRALAMRILTDMKQQRWLRIRESR